MLNNMSFGTSKLGYILLLTLLGHGNFFSFSMTKFNPRLFNPDAFKVFLSTTFFNNFLSFKNFHYVKMIQEQFNFAILLQKWIIENVGIYYLIYV